MLDLPPRVEQDGHCVFVDRLACVDPIRPSSKRDQQHRADLKPRQHQQVALDSADPRQAGGSLECVQESETLVCRRFHMGSIAVATSHLSPPWAVLTPTWGIGATSTETSRECETEKVRLSMRVLYPSSSSALTESKLYFRLTLRATSPSPSIATFAPLATLSWLVAGLSNPFPSALCAALARFSLSSLIWSTTMATAVAVWSAPPSG
ncbi:unnamed protein product [Vitrella brassicaformis CCMP3155]|uniref:Uncharacterized protein n=1 Tax=Vitrella brassicaformis (strain CCMP3155) TaxID=1169540 RepID=A0A0G4FQ50_VITBC|nr:unnamed protein product [Vitrella brassicaformis CCMP3155]|eukprot:CEM15959.1 unnamed protein product [Vitrella brassicaformis CCMP3155]